MFEVFPLKGYSQVLRQAFVLAAPGRLHVLTLPLRAQVYGLATVMVFHVLALPIHVPDVHYHHVRAFWNLLLQV